MLLISADPDQGLFDFDQTTARVTTLKAVPPGVDTYSLTIVAVDDGQCCGGVACSRFIITCEKLDLVLFDIPYNSYKQLKNLHKHLKTKS